MQSQNVRAITVHRYKPVQCFSSARLWIRYSPRFHLSEVKGEKRGVPVIVRGQVSILGESRRLFQDDRNLTFLVLKCLLHNILQ